MLLRQPVSIISSIPTLRVMRDNGQKCFVQAYNVQIAVDAHAQVIVAAELTQQTIDRQQLLPLVKSVCSTVQATPKTITADARYWDTASLLDPSLKALKFWFHLTPIHNRPERRCPPVHLVTKKQSA